jgi:23S rRNA (cytidine1920-2'-O)/16S rRNA (cytidine1409-2'-O)-methyltransferase
MPRVRADVLMVARGLAESREAAQRLISAGRVRSGTTTFVKASQLVAEDAPLELSEPERYVSRGGRKLLAALDAFAVDPRGRRCLDLGASTGGFTDCLLQRGAAHVIAVDVGRAQLHQRLRDDPRVTLLEGVNARELPPLEAKGEGEQAKVQEEPSSSFRVLPPGSLTLFVADLSFISLRKVLPSVAGRLARRTEGIVLLNPKIEAGPKDVPRGGVIRNAAVLERVKAEFLEWLAGNGWHVYGMIPSPVRGGDGNQEFLVHLATPGEV